MVKGKPCVLTITVFNLAMPVVCRSSLNSLKEKIEMYYLEKRVPEKNQYRFYCIHITTGIFGVWAVVREWGRIGSPGTVRSLWFDDENRAKEIANNLKLVKQKKGYEIRGATVSY